MGTSAAKEVRYKEKITDIVRRYQSGCLDFYVKEAIDDGKSRIPVCVQKTWLKWRCLDADELAVLYVYSESRNTLRGVKLSYIEGSLTVGNYSLSRWFSTCRSEDCGGLNIPVPERPGYKLGYESLYLPLFSIAYFTHNLHRFQTIINPNEEIQRRMSRLAKPFLFYISTFHVNTLVFGYYAIYKSLLGKYVASQKATGTAAEIYWNTWDKWQSFKEEITVLRDLWDKEEPQYESFFSQYFVHVHSKEITSSIWSNLHRFLNERDKDFKDARDKERIKKQKGIVAKIVGLFLNTEGFMIKSSNKAEVYETITNEIKEYINNTFKTIEG